MTLYEHHTSKFYYYFISFKIIIIILKYKKRTHLCKIKRISFQECKKNQKHGYTLTNGFYNFDNSFHHICKTHEYELLFYNVLMSCI